MRDNLPDTRQLHTAHGERPPNGRASIETQPGPRTSRPEQDRRGTNETPTQTHDRRTRPRRGVLCLHPHPGTKCNPQLTRGGREHRPYPHTRHQPRSPCPNTRTPNPNLSRSVPGTAHMHPHTARVPARAGSGQAGTQTRTRTKPETRTRRSHPSASPKTKRARGTTVGNRVSKARTLRQPVACR